MTKNKDDSTILPEPEKIKKSITKKSIIIFIIFVSKFISSN